jgi:OmpA-OmpF porin, OOP family
MLKTHTRVVAACLAAAGSALAAAQGKFYVAGSLGSSQASGDYTGQVRAAGAPAEGFAFISAGRDGGNEFGGRLAAGYRLTDFIAVELGYTQFGKFGVGYQFEKRTGLIPAQRFFTGSGQQKLDGVTLDLVGTIPITGPLSAQARVGVIATNLRYSEDQTFLNQGTTSFSATERQTRLHLGIGAAYRVNKTFDVTLDYTRAQDVGNKFQWTEDGNGRLSYGLIALGVRYRF